MKGRERKIKGRTADCDANLLPVKERGKEEGFGRKSLRLQCSSKNVSATSMGSSPAQVSSWGSFPFFRMDCTSTPTMHCEALGQPRGSMASLQMWWWIQRLQLRLSVHSVSASRRPKQCILMATTPRNLEEHRPCYHISFICQVTLHWAEGSRVSNFQFVIHGGYFSLTKAELTQSTPPSFLVSLLFATRSLHILGNMDFISLWSPVHLLLGTDKLILGYSSVGLGNRKNKWGIKAGL